jgi:hypothetical protein
LLWPAGERKCPVGRLPVGGASPWSHSSRHGPQRPHESLSRAACMQNEPQAAPGPPPPAAHHAARVVSRCDPTHRLAAQTPHAAMSPLGPRSTPPRRARAPRSMVIPDRGQIYSLNDARRWEWPDGLRRYVDAIQRGEGEHPKQYSARYVCSLGGWGADDRPGAWIGVGGGLAWPGGCLHFVSRRGVGQTPPPPSQSRTSTARC